MPAHHQERPLDPFSKRFDACLDAYDRAGGDPGEKELFKEQVRHALSAREYSGPVLKSDAAAPYDAWLPILHELDAMCAALRQSGPPSSSSSSGGRESLLSRRDLGEHLFLGAQAVKMADAVPSFSNCGNQS